jgi:hypothetical protein
MMKIRRLLTVMVILIAVLVPSLIFALQSTPQFLCSTPSGFCVEVNPDHYLLDLQCQPVLNKTLEIEPGDSMRFTVNLANYYAASGRNNAVFDIHLAIDRARIVVRAADALEGTTITDTFASLQNVLMNTSDQSYTFVVENRGLRSAVFDLSVRVRN